jgi:mono/diheme cytochrome c family protein
MLGWTAIGLVALLLLIQAVPYGRDHTNPPVLAAPSWDSARTEQLFATACGDCHSNLTKWPWYTNVAPASWLVQRDVDDGRSTMNLSELGHTKIDLDEIAEVVRQGDMPPLQYRLIHRDASLSQAEREELIQGLTATLQSVATR